MQDRRIEVFYDAGCWLCRREILFLKRMDRNENIRATNIADPDFCAPDGYTWEALMARIHARLPNDEVIEGPEVFRRLYIAAGLGWAVPFTRLPGIEQCINMGYRIFARYRVARRKSCRDGSCRVSSS